MTFIAKWLASQTSISSVSLGDSFWAILLGAAWVNWVQGNMPSIDWEWIKAAQQTELYIAVSLVMLCINIDQLSQLASKALLVSYVDTPILFIFCAMIGIYIMKMDRESAIILSGATLICGSSAAVALATSVGAKGKAEMPIVVLSIFTIPSIVALPYIAHALGINAYTAGAWFGGCVDSTVRRLILL